MKKFINDPFDVVDEMLEGFLDVHKSYVKKIESARTLVRADAPVKGKVGVLTGGGSGHKPAFIGFIGKGMLDAVAVGEIFTSPPPLAVYEGAKAVNGGKGVVFLLGNYSGDVMNFGLAAEMCREEGIPVEQVIATDDVGSGPKEKAYNRRGVVGEFFAWKVAGARARSRGQSGRGQGHCREGEPPDQDDRCGPDPVYGARERKFNLYSGGGRDGVRCGTPWGARNGEDQDAEGGRDHGDDGGRGDQGPSL